MTFSFDFFWAQALPQLLRAIPVTLWLTLLSGIGCLLLGMALAIALGSAHRSLRWPAQVYATVVRGTPLLVQIYFIYYGLGSLVPREWMRDSWASPLLRDAFWYGLVALIINEAAYVGVILRGGLNAIPKGETEAAAALGLPAWTRWVRLRIPRVTMLTLPMLCNEAVLLLKSTVLVSTITIFDVLGTANLIRFKTFRITEPLMAAALIYIVMVLCISLASLPLERRFARMRLR
jgi:His/Glu/Gln/Arg/opine family amino acid ABC transporter permease subunit